MGQRLYFSDLAPRDLKCPPPGAAHFFIACITCLRVTGHVINGHFLSSKYAIGNAFRPVSYLSIEYSFIVQGRFFSLLNKEAEFGTGLWWYLSPGGSFPKEGEILLFRFIGLVAHTSYCYRPAPLSGKSTN